MQISVGAQLLARAQVMELWQNVLLLTRSGPWVVVAPDPGGESRIPALKNVPAVMNVVVKLRLTN
jgi:hypothetical protein